MIRKMNNLIIVRETHPIEGGEGFLLVVFPDGSCVGRWNGLTDNGKKDRVKFKGTAFQAKMFIMNNLCPDVDFPELEKLGYKI